MLGFDAISTLPLDTLPLGIPAVVIPPPVTPATPAGGGVNWRQLEYLRSLEPKPKTAKKTALTRKANHVTAKARFNIPRLQFRAAGEVRGPIATPVLNPITGTARFTIGTVGLRADGEIVSITDDDLMDFSHLVEELLDA